MHRGSWFNEGACHMNTTTHTVGVPFPQAFTAPKCCLFPSAPRYSMRLARLTRDMLRSNQTARCDECASPQTWREFSRCYLAPCERALHSVSILSWLSRLSLNNHEWTTHSLSTSTLSTQRKVEPFIPAMNARGFLAR